MGCSVDSEYVHLAWTNTPRNQGGIGKLKFPLLADVQHKICQVLVLFWCLPPLTRAPHAVFPCRLMELRRMRTGMRASLCERLSSSVTRVSSGTRRSWTCKSGATPKRPCGWCKPSSSQMKTGRLANLQLHRRCPRGQTAATALTHRAAGLPRVVEARQGDDGARPQWQPAVLQDAAAVTAVTTVMMPWPWWQLQLQCRQGKVYKGTLLQVEWRQR